MIRRLWEIALIQILLKRIKKIVDLFIIQLCIRINIMCVYIIVYVRVRLCVCVCVRTYIIERRKKNARLIILKRIDRFHHYIMSFLCGFVPFWISRVIVKVLVICFQTFLRVFVSTKQRWWLAAHQPVPYLTTKYMFSCTTYVGNGWMHYHNTTNTEL